MKKAFYTYWFAYLTLMAVNLSGLTACLWVSQLFKVVFYLTYIFLAGYPMYVMYIHHRSLTEINHKYLKAIIVSFIVRSMLWICASFGYSDRWEVLAFLGGGMLFYYIFEVRLKIKKIENNLFRY